jgi:hypothetical protein
MVLGVGSDSRSVGLSYIDGYNYELGKGRPSGGDVEDSRFLVLTKVRVSLLESFQHFHPAQTT